MIVRGVDANNDWLFGKGKNDYKTANSAVAQMIKTRCQSFLGDCFWSINDGIDWFNILGGKDTELLSLELSTVILNTDEVTGLVELNVDLNRNTRKITIQYIVTTTFSTIPSSFDFNIGSLIGGS